jgi:hypothetical protein
MITAMNDRTEHAPPAAVSSEVSSGVLEWDHARLARLVGACLVLNQGSEGRHGPERTRGTESRTSHKREFECWARDW